MVRTRGKREDMAPKDRESRKRVQYPAFVILVSVFCMLSSLSFAAGDVGGKPEKSDIVVTYAQPSGAFTPIWVAHDAGLFKKYGLNAKLQLLNPQVSAQAVISGEADFYTDGPDLINARLRGGEVKYFGGTMQQLVFQLWGAKEITSIQHLKGKTVAASTPRAALDTATRETLKKNRIAVQVSYKNQIVLIDRFGTHAEYSKWKF